MSDVICLSSDEDEPLPVTKKPRLEEEEQTPRLEVKQYNIEEAIAQEVIRQHQSKDICLISSSDEEEEEGKKTNAGNEEESVKSEKNVDDRTEEVGGEAEQNDVGCGEKGGEDGGVVIDLESSDDETDESQTSEKATQPAAATTDDVALDLGPSAVNGKTTSDEEEGGAGTSRQSEDSREADEPPDPGNKSDSGDEANESEEAEESEEDRFAEFINLCLEIVNENKKPEHIRIITAKAEVVRKMHAKVGPEFCTAPSFQNLLGDSLKRIRSRRSDADVVVCFVQVYDELKHRYQDGCAAAASSRTNDKRLANLERLMHKLQRRVQRLEDAEVDFDDEENSHYLQLETYKRKLVSVYGFYCKLKKQDVNTALTMFPRLDFASSQYTEINKAINRKYNNNPAFPTFYDFDRYIRRKVEDGLGISSARLHDEIKSCFTKFGDLLQKRRKIELLTAHNTFMTTVVDPASEDPELEAKLRANKRECDERTNSICEKFVRLQESRTANAETDQECSSSQTSSDSD